MLFLVKPAQPFRVTLNAPAASLLFGGASAIEFRLTPSDQEDGHQGVRVRPSDAPDAFPLVARGERGRLEAAVDGPTSSVVTEIVRHMTGGRVNPIFILVPDADMKDWLRLVPAAETPPRHLPQLRVWQRAEPQPGEARVIEEPEWATAIRSAAATIKAHETSGRLGRPPKNVQAAEQIMAIFKLLVNDLLPPRVDRAQVLAAKEALDRALDGA